MVETVHGQITSPYRAALRMVREVIGELFGHIADLESEEAVLLRGPEPHHDAEAIIEALHRIEAELSRIKAGKVKALLGAIYSDPQYVAGGFPARDDEELLYPGSPYDRGRYDARKIVRDYFAALEPAPSDPTPVDTDIPRIYEDAEGAGEPVASDHVEQLAAFLCSEFDFDLDPCHGYAWPEHENDDGYRDGGYVKLQPKDVQAHARDNAKRILSFVSTLYAHPSPTPAGVTEAWQPIETAPICTDVLVCVTYNISSDEWETMKWVDWLDTAGRWRIYPTRIDIPSPPTHWMPLPAAPEASR